MICLKSHEIRQYTVIAVFPVTVHYRRMSFRIRASLGSARTADAATGVRELGLKNGAKARRKRRRDTAINEQRDATRHDATRRDATRRDTMQRDATRRDATLRNTTQRDATRRDATRRNATRRDDHRLFRRRKRSCDKNNYKISPNCRPVFSNYSSYYVGHLLTYVLLYITARQNYIT